MLFIGLVGSAMAQADAAAQDGEQIYATNCATCHGDELRNPGSSFDLKDLKTAERARFDKSVMEGKGQMPPWRGALTPADMDALWAYIRANAYD
jgi:mono/diheme cytochrome c family protein